MSNNFCETKYDCQSVQFDICSSELNGSEFIGIYWQVNNALF